MALVRFDRQHCAQGLICFRLSVLFLVCGFKIYHLKKLKLISVDKLGDVGISSNLIGSIVSIRLTIIH